MRLFLSRVCGPLAVAASVLALPVAAAAQSRNGRDRRQGFRRRPRRRPSLLRRDQAAQPAATPDPLAEDSRSLFAPSVEHVPALRSREQHLGRPGALAAIPGSSATGCCSRRDACCMKRPTGTAASAPTTSAGATSATSAATNGSASSKSTDSSMRFRSSTASIHAPRSSRPETGYLCWTTTPNARRTSTRYLPISPQFDLRESRKIGTFRVSATPTTPPRRHWRLHDDEALGGVAVGGELRVQQRQRGRAALQVPHQRHGHGP